MSNNKIIKQANSINPPRRVSFSLSARVVLLELANEQRLIHLFLYIFGRFSIISLVTMMSTVSRQLRNHPAVSE